MQRPPRFNLRFTRLNAGDPNVQYSLNNGGPYRIARFVPLVLISSLWLSPALQQKTTSWIDRNFIGHQGLLMRNEFYVMNRIYEHNAYQLPKASLFRRIGAWILDGAIISVGTVSFVTLLRIPSWIGTVSASLLWFGRDIWLQRIGLQSPGRYVFGLYAVSMNGPQFETWGTMKLNSVIAVLLGASDFIRSPTFIQMLQRGNAQQRHAWLVFIAVTHTFLAIITVLGYGMGAGQLMMSKQTWFDKIAQIQVVNISNLPLQPIPTPNDYNHRRKTATLVSSSNTR